MTCWELVFKGDTWTEIEDAVIAKAELFKRQREAEAMLKDNNIISIKAKKRSSSK